MLKFFVSACLVGLSAVAQAATFNIGSLPVAPSVYTNTASVSGSFTDIYNFVFPNVGATASGSAVSINISPILVIDNINVSIFDSSNALVAAGPIGTSSVLFDVALVPGASYYYSITGTATGQVGGIYSFLASAAPVPEPGTYALLLGGLAGLAFIVKRRRRDL
jgi:hypothetical protein